MKTLIISNDEMNDIIKIVKCLETETVQNEVTEQKGRFFSMLLGTLGATLLGNILTGRGVKTSSQGWGVNRGGEGVLRAGYGSRSTKMDF